MAIIGESYTPLERAKPKQLAKLRPNSAFQYAHHARGWQIMHTDKGAPVLLPMLTRIDFRPGTNHISNDMDLTECRMRFEANGYQFIPFDLAAKADKGAASYIQRVQVKGGFAYLSRWCRVVPGTSRTMQDKAGWRRFLVAVAKYVNPAPAWVLDEMRTRYQRQQARLARSASVIPDAEEQIAECAAILKLLDREIKKAEARDMSTGDEVIPNAAD